MKTYFRRNSMSEKSKNLLLAIIPVVITGALCSYFSRTGVSGWYSKMATSTITPPNYIFSLVWSIIYICLILSVYRILASHKQSLCPSSILATADITGFMVCFIFRYAITTHRRCYYFMACFDCFSNDLRFLED